MADSINKNAEDGMGRSYSGIDLNMLKSMFCGKVGDEKPFNSKGTDEIKEEIAKLAKLLASKNAQFAKDIQKAVSYINEMKNVLSSVTKKVGSKEEKGSFGDMANALGKLLAPMIKNSSKNTSDESIKKAIYSSSSELKIGFRGMEKASSQLASIFGEFLKMMEPFVDEGLKKGSIFTRDERLSNRIGKGIKIEKGTLGKMAKAIGGPQSLTKQFVEVFSDIQPQYQSMISEIFQRATDLSSKQGVSQIEAYNEAFKQVLDENAVGGEEREQLLQNQEAILLRVQALQKENKLTEHLLSTTAALVEKFGSLVQSITKVDTSVSGMVKGSVDLFNTQSDLKQAMFETSGIVGQTVEQQKEIANLSRTIAETGFAGEEASKQMIKYQRGGLKLNKDTTRIVKSQLSVEKQLGLEAGSMQEHFKSMSMEAGFSSGQIEQMGQDMKSVAKSSGLSGEAMKDVVQKTRELTKLLQSSGTLTVDANKNVLGFMAEAKKMGVEEGASSFGKALSSMGEFNKSQDRFLQNAVANSGNFGKVLDRSLLGNKQALFQVAEQYQKNVTSSLSKAAGQEIKTYADFQRAKTKAEMKGDQAALNSLAMARENVERATGKSLEEALKVPEALMKGITDANKPLIDKKKKLEEDEKKGLIDKAQKEQQIKKLEAESATSLLSKMQEVSTAADGAGDFAEMLKKTGGQALADIAENASPEEALNKSLESVNKRLKDAGVKELNLSQDLLKKAVSGGADGAKAMEEVQEAVMKANKEADEADMRKNNPAYDAAQTLHAINEQISSFGAGVLGWLGKWGLILGGVAAGLVSLVTVGKSIWGFLQTTGNLISGKGLAPPPAPPPNLAPAPPPNLDGKKTPVPAPPPNTGETKGKDVVVSPKEKSKVDDVVVSPKEKSKVDNVVVSPKEKAKVDDATSKPKGKAGAKAVAAGGKDVSPAGKKPVVPKGKAVSAKPKGKLGAIMSGGSAMAGGLAETAMSVIGGGEDEGCACSVAESALSKVSGIAGIATDAAMTAADVALDTTKKTGKAVANVADDAAKGAAKGAAKATAKGITSSVDDAAIAVTKSAGAMSSATGFMGKSLGVLGKVAGPLVSVAGAGIEIAAGGDVTEAISGGVGGLIGGALLGTVGTFIGGPIGTAVGGAIGAYAGDWLGRIGSEYLPGVWEGVKDVSSSIWEGTKDVASSLWDSAGTVAGGLADGAVSLAKGIDDFTGGRISAATDAIGGVASDVAGWTGDKISGAASAVGNAASAVGSAASAGWSSFTGWLGFAEGAREIDNNGLAMLHKGEVIFPKSIVESLVAKGTSSFGSLGGYLQDVGGGLASAASKFVESGGVGGLLGSAVTNLGSSLAGYAGSIFGSPSKMQGEMATAELTNGSNKASSLATAGSAALSNIASATESQNSISSEIKGVLKDILQEMIKSNNGDGGGSGETYTGMSSNRDAFKSPIGNINDVAVKNVTEEAYG